MTGAAAVRHELHLLRRGLMALLPVTGVLVVAGALVAGRSGAVSALVGAGLVVANHAAAALSTGWSRTLEPRVLAVGFGGWAVRMVGVVVAFAILATFPWVHRPLVVIGFGTALIVVLTAECWSYARGTYVPRWRMVS